MTVNVHNKLHVVASRQLQHSAAQRHRSSCRKLRLLLYTTVHALLFALRYVCSAVLPTRCCGAHVNEGCWLENRSALAEYRQPNTQNSVGRTLLKEDSVLHGSSKRRPQTR